MTAPLDAASAAAFRIAFGLLMLALVARFFAHGWIDEYFLAPRHFFPYYGFEWVRPWPGVGMYIHFAAMGALALCITLGLWYRASVVGFGALFTYAHLIDKTNYLNHYYLVICLCLLMAFLPLHRAASLDARRRPALAGATVPAWALWALRAQIGLVYVFGGIAKLKADWLIDAQPMQIWLSANTDVPLLGSLFGEQWMAYAMSYAGAAFDLSIVPLLLWRRSRPLAFGALVVFHLVTMRLFQLGMFPWIMMASSLVFLPPDWPRRLAARLGHGAGRGAAAPAPAPAAAAAGRPRLVLALLGVYFAFHVLMPFRHLLYPGDVLWTEEGFRFSWNVMLMEKNGSVDARVRDPATGQQWVVAPGTYLTRYQTKMMAAQPDMILHFAHLVAADFRARGVRDPEVRVDAVASLNGRRRARLVDPTVDLAREPDGLGPKRWILPRPSGEDPRSGVAQRAMPSEP
ncbi:MAG TPA: HTTM domain-containing protein [Kofleriaceae bacterium]|nr:HTTM domain-containing protein [Kofleriaceae bacterium]